MICRFVDGIDGETLLDLNDETNYWYLDGSEFPLPEVIYEWVENESHGRRLASWRLDSNTLTLCLLIKGTDSNDTYLKLRTFLKRLLKENTLEIRLWGADLSVFYHTYPALPKLPDVAKKFVIDENYVSNISVEIPVNVKVKTSAETIMVTEPLGTNDDFETHTGNDFAGWTEIQTNAGTVTVVHTGMLHGGHACALTTTAGGTDVAGFRSDYKAVNAERYHQLQVYCDQPSDAAEIDVDLLCYNDANDLLGTLNLVTGFAPTGGPTDICERYGGGVISPVGGAAPSFPEGTTKVKREIRNVSTIANVAIVDRIHFCDTQDIPGHKMSGVFGINIPPESCKGDIAAKADVFIDVVYDRFSKLILGQRKEYHSDFNPVAEPTNGGRAFNWKRRSQDYRVISPRMNRLDMVNNRHSFEDYTGSGNSTDWVGWGEARQGNTYEIMQADSVKVYHLSYSVKVGATHSGYKVYCTLVNLTTININPAKLYYLSFHGASSGPAGGQLRTELQAGLIDSTPELFEYRLLWAGVPEWSYPEIGAYLDPATLPSRAVAFYLTLVCKADNPMSAIGYHYWDLARVLEFDPLEAEAAFPVESHTGRAYILGGLSFGASTNYDEVMIHALLQNAGLPITPAVELTSVDLENPYTEFRELIFSSDRPRITIPSQMISENADTADLDQVIGVRDHPANAANLWVDHIGLMYYDRAITTVNEWGQDHLIFDSRSSKSVLASLDGTFEKAHTYNHTSWKGTPEFEVDPDGINMTLCAIKGDTDYEVTPIVGIKIVYNPTYLLVAAE